MGPEGHKGTFGIGKAASRKTSELTYRESTNKIGGRQKVKARFSHC
jgi:hypothetical protein